MLSLAAVAETFPQHHQQPRSMVNTLHLAHATCIQAALDEESRQLEAVRAGLQAKLAEGGAQLAAREAALGAAEAAAKEREEEIKQQVGPVGLLFIMYQY